MLAHLGKRNGTLRLENGDFALPGITPEPSFTAPPRTGYRVIMPHGFDDPHGFYPCCLWLINTFAAPNADGGYDCSVVFSNNAAVTFDLKYRVMRRLADGSLEETTQGGVLAEEHTLARNSIGEFTITIPPHYLTCGDLYIILTVYESWQAS